MSRNDPKINSDWIEGDFSSYEDLRMLDGKSIDVTIHLAAVTGGCSERDGLLINVEGTRTLLNYLIKNGCKKFILASSIASVGVQNKKFRPSILPINDEHPCFDRDGYGFSKFLMEEVSKYSYRQNPSIDIINLRLAAISPDENMPPPFKVEPLREWALCYITLMTQSDAVRAFKLAADSPYKPGVRIMNATGPKSWVADPVAEILETWWGNDVDLSYFKKVGNEFNSVYDVTRIKDEIGFVAKNITPGL